MWITWLMKIDGWLAEHGTIATRGASSEAGELRKETKLAGWQMPVSKVSGTFTRSCLHTIACSMVRRVEANHQKRNTEVQDFLPSWPFALASSIIQC